MSSVGNAASNSAAENDKLSSANTLDQYALNEVVVTANRIPVDMRRIATSVSVLDEDQLQAYGNLVLVDVLRQLPSTSVSGNGGAGKTTSMRIRGEESYRTLVLYDGIRLSDPSSTQIAPHMEHLLSGAIGRVEVLRGPQGLGYGADAGGVVALFSPTQSRGLNSAFSAQSGSFNSRQYSARVSYGNATTESSLSLSDFSSDLFNSYKADNVQQDKDGYDNLTWHARLAHALTDKLEISGVHHDVRGNTAFDNCYGLSLTHNCDSAYVLDADRLALSYSSEQSKHSLAYSRTLSRRSSYADDQFSYAMRGELQRLDYLGSTTVLSGAELVFGLDLELARNEGEGRYNRGVFAEYLSDFSPEFFVSAGLRHDNNEDFGSNNSYRVSAAWLPPLFTDASVKIRVSSGTGFRAPSPYEIAYNASSYALPPASNLSLQQEISRGWEAGVDYLHGSGLQLGLTWFDQRVENAIEFDLAAYSGYLQEVGVSNSQGIEFNSLLPLYQHLSFQLNYTRNQTSRPDGTVRLRRPRHITNVGLTWQPQTQGLAANAFYRVVRDTVDEPGGISQKLDNYQVLDLSLSWQLNSQWQLFGRLENALDETYEEIAGYYTAGQAAYIGFSYSPAHR